MHAGASKVSVVDTVGAGDFFTAGFLYALLSNASLQVGARILLLWEGGEELVPSPSSLWAVLARDTQPLFPSRLYAVCCAQLGKVQARPLENLPPQHPVQACALCGCAAGTAAVQVAGAELGPERLRELRSAIGGILQAAAPGEAAAAPAVARSG